MSSVKDDNTGTNDVAEVKVSEEKKEKQKKELTPQEIQKRKKMLVYPLFFLLFVGAIWLIFAPSGKKNEEKQPDGFNPELPVPTEEVIVDDKRTAYEQEDRLNREEEKRRSLQDFAFMLGEVGKSKIEDEYEDDPSDYGHEYPTSPSSRSGSSIRASSYAYEDVNRQLENWYDQPATEIDEQSQLALEWRIQELERKLDEVESRKNSADEQLELIEKTYAIAAKYMPNTLPQGSPETTNQAVDNSMPDKVTPTPLSKVQSGVVSRLATPMENDEFIGEYSKPRNYGFLTAAGTETEIRKNAIRACVYRTTKLSDGKEIQLRLLEPMMAGSILIPVNSVFTGSARIAGERLSVTVNSIQYGENIVPVELVVYDLDGLQGFSAPSSDEANAAREITANMGTSAGSSFTITNNAGSQLAADMARSTIQGASQFFSKKMRQVEITLKANHQVLLLPK